MYVCMYVCMYVPNNTYLPTYLPLVVPTPTGGGKRSAAPVQRTNERPTARPILPPPQGLWTCESYNKLK